MYKDGNTISIDLVHSVDTKEKNGFSVQIYLDGEYQIKDFEKAIHRQLPYFENLYVHCHNSICSLEEDYNKSFIKHYKNFSVSSHKPYYLDCNVKILLGKVLYPLDILQIDNKFTNYHRWDIALRFDIGELSITPNREEITYNEETVKKINEKFQKAVDEINAIAEEQYSKDYTDFQEYLQDIDYENHNLLDVGDNSIVSIPIKKPAFATYKGKRYSRKTVKKYKNIIYHRWNIIKKSHFLYNDRLSYYEYNVNISSLNTLENYIITDMNSTSIMFKRYIKYLYRNKRLHIFKPLKYSSKDTIKIYRNLLKNLRDELTFYHQNKLQTPIDFKAVRLFLPDIQKFLKEYEDNTVGNDFVPQSFIDNYKAEQKKKREATRLAKKNNSNPALKTNEIINLYEVRYVERGIGMATNSVKYTFKELPYKKELTVYGSKDDERLDTLYQYIQKGSLNLSVVKVAPTRIKKLKGIE